MRRVEQHPPVRVGAEPPVRGQARDTPVGDGDPLGPPGRTGCVHHVHEAVGTDTATARQVSEEGRPVLARPLLVLADIDMDAYETVVGAGP